MNSKVANFGDMDDTWMLNRQINTDYEGLDLE
uniref:Uncharacterized protein n=1 Tax=Arundo donax TaxID=35708 RepID=A0A0A9FDQ2_ARUDO